MNKKKICLFTDIWRLQLRCLTPLTPLCCLCVLHLALIAEMPDSTHPLCCLCVLLSDRVDAGVQRKHCCLRGRVPSVATLTDDYTQEELDSIFGFDEEAACFIEEVLLAASHLIV